MKLNYFYFSHLLKLHHDNNLELLSEHSSRILPEAAKSDHKQVNSSNDHF